jgi:RNA polymerase sigma-70 factor (ECF subfamily)
MLERDLGPLIARCQSGDMQAFRTLVRENQSYAFGLALRVLHNEQDAEDVTQEAFIRVWKHLRGFDPRSRFTTWLYSIVSNLCLDRLRSEKRWRKLVTREDTGNESEQLPGTQRPEDIQSNIELVGIIRRLTERLPPKQRLVFTLRDFEECSIEETSEMTGLSVGAVKTNLYHARRHIRDILSREYDIKGA